MKHRAGVACGLVLGLSIATLSIRSERVATADPRSLPPRPSPERSPFESEERPRSLSAPSRNPPDPQRQRAASPRAPQDDRLAALEQKIDRLLETMEGLR